MKQFSTINMLAGTLLGTTMIVGTALANPALLPDHPGHPMKPLESPVTGQALANDPGRDLWTGEQAMQAATKSEIRKAPEWNEKDTNVKNKGAGVLPGLTKGYPDYKINPPVKSATNPNR